MNANHHLNLNTCTEAPPAFSKNATHPHHIGDGPRHDPPRQRHVLTRVPLFLLLVVSASAQYLTVSGGGTINLGQSANIVASPTTGVATAYALIENGVTVQTVGTFGIGGSSHDVGRPHTFTVTPRAAGTYIYSAQVALNVFRGHIDYAPSDNSVTLTVVPVFRSQRRWLSHDGGRVVVPDTKGWL